MSTVDDVVKWMQDQMNHVGVLSQSTAVYQIRQLFGDTYVYTNANGNLAINQAVLRKFNKVTADDVIWSRGDKAWRRRHQFHKPGRQQD